MALCLQTYSQGGRIYLVQNPNPSGSRDYGDCAYVALTGQEFSNIQNLANAVQAPFDYVQAGLIFSFFFSFTVGLWWFSKNLGVILSAVKRF